MTNSQWYLITWGLVGAVWVMGWIYNAYFGPQVVERQGNVRWLTWLVRIALAWLVLRWVPANSWFPFAIQSSWLWTAGLVILTVSTLFVLWARFVLGTLWAGTAMVKQNHQLRTEGPYRITRHPIYTGLLGMAIGSMLMNGFGILLLAVPVMIVFFKYKIHTEEALLSKTFGEQYAEYKRRVPQLVPGLF